MRQAASSLAPAAAMVGSVSEVVTHPGVDCVLIASPNHLHFAQLKEIAAIRPLPLLVEKPLFTDPAGCRRRAEFRQDLSSAGVGGDGVPLHAAGGALHRSRPRPSTGGIRMLTIREHRYPFLEKVGNWNRFNRNSGGTFVEKCCHFFDLMRLILKSEPVRVMASAGQAVNHLDERYDGEVPDILDNGYVLVDFESGARAMLELCMFADGSRYQEEFERRRRGGQDRVPGAGSGPVLARAS